MRVYVIMKKFLFRATDASADLPKEEAAITCDVLPPSTNGIVGAHQRTPVACASDTQHSLLNRQRHLGISRRTGINAASIQGM